MQLPEWNRDAQRRDICAWDEARKSPGARPHAPFTTLIGRARRQHIHIFIVIYDTENIHFIQANISGYPIARSLYVFIKFEMFI